MPFGGKHRPKYLTYKYLSVALMRNLPWSSHIENIVKTASNSLGYLRQTFTLAPSHTKLRAYQTLVRPKLKYASPTWCSWQNYLASDLEAVQSRALLFIYSDYSFHTSITELRTRAGILTLPQHQLISHLVLFHKNLFLRCSLLCFVSFFLLIFILLHTFKCFYPAHE